MLSEAFTGQTGKVFFISIGTHLHLCVYVWKKSLSLHNHATMATSKPCNLAI